MPQNNWLNLYTEFLQKFIAPSRPLRIVFDCSNGTTGLVLAKLKFKNCEIKIINSEPNGNFPAHGPNPSKPKAIGALAAAVKDFHADLGAIFDGDGDRALFVNDKNRQVNPDVIARLLLWELKPQKIVVDMRTGWLVKNLQTKNLKLATAKIGHFFIKKSISEKKADFGAEFLGHYYFVFPSSYTKQIIPLPSSSRREKKEKLYFDSGILTAITVINALSRLPYKLSDYIALLPSSYRPPEINFSLSLPAFSQPQQLLKSVESHFRKNALKISRLDGLTMEFADWWFNLRYSQTESCLRLNMETVNKQRFQEEFLQIKKFLKK